MNRCQLCHCVGRHLQGCPNDSHYRSNADKNGAWCEGCGLYRATSVTCQTCAESRCASCMVEHKCSDTRDADGSASPADDDGGQGSETKRPISDPLRELLHKEQGNIRFLEHVVKDHAKSIKHLLDVTHPLTVPDERDTAAELLREVVEAVLDGDTTSTYMNEDDWLDEGFRRLARALTSAREYLDKADVGSTDGRGAADSSTVEQTHAVADDKVKMPGEGCRFDSGSDGFGAAGDLSSQRTPAGVESRPTSAPRSTEAVERSTDALERIIKRISYSPCDGDDLLTSEARGELDDLIAASRPARSMATEPTKFVRYTVGVDRSCGETTCILAGVSADGVTHVLSDKVTVNMDADDTAHVAGGGEAVRLADVLKDYRWARRLTTRELAKEIGVSHSTLNRFEDSRGALSGEALAKVLRWLLTDKAKD